MASRWPMIKTVGPTIPSVYLDKQLEDDKYYGLNLFHPSAEACMKWLDTKEKSSVVYASFGSVATVGGSQMEELAMGRKNSNENFLWVVRASEESKLPCNFVAETSEKAIYKCIPNRPGRELVSTASGSVPPSCGEFPDSLQVELHLGSHELGSADGGNAAVDGSNNKCKVHCGCLGCRG